MTDPNVPSETPVTPAATPPAAATPPVAPPAVPPAAATPPVSPYAAPTAAGPKQGLSLTSFITGLGALVFSWIPFIGIIGFLAGIVAVITGFMAKRKEPAAPKWMWIVGLIAGFVGIAISLIYLIGFILLLAVGTAAGNYGY